LSKDAFGGSVYLFSDYFEVTPQEFRRVLLTSQSSCEALSKVTDMEIKLIDQAFG
jgi:hypothetical protein